MQFLDNDSNDWVRKAAEDYPVKPFGMDWDSVAKQLQDEEPITETKGPDILRYAVMLILFMMLGLVLNKYLRLDFDKRYATAPPYNKLTNTIKDVVNQENVTVNKNGKSLFSNVGTGNNGADLNKIHDSKEVPFVTSNDLRTLAVMEKQHSTEVSGKDNVNQRLDFSKIFVLSKSQIDLLNNNKLVKEDMATVPTSEHQKTEKVFKKGVLYAGMIMGPDFSTVKFQKSNGMGYNWGLLLGYKFSPKWQLESGVLINHKTYYSDGEYFNVEKSYLPTHTYIKKVDGSCNMFEIPLNIRYNITQKNESNWFATAGVSSYIMNKEDYNITYTRYNVEYTGNKVYYNGANNWLTAFNASVGFEKGINQKLKLRIEPYLRLPLKGMGTGRLPISSGGLNLGASYPIK